MPDRRRVVVALGGNALSPSGGTGDVREMPAVLEQTAISLVELVEEDVELVTEMVRADIEAMRSDTYPLMMSA